MLLVKLRLLKIQKIGVILNDPIHFIITIKLLFFKIYIINYKKIDGLVV